jgi:Tfp pilus assembly protein PilV
MWWCGRILDNQHCRCYIAHMAHCKSCNHELADQAGYCPTCGAAIDKPNDGSSWGIGLILLLMLVVILGAAFIRGHSVTQHQQSSVGTTTVMSAEEYFGPDDLEREQQAARVAFVEFAASGQSDEYTDFVTLGDVAANVKYGESQLAAVIWNGSKCQLTSISIEVTSVVSEPAKPRTLVLGSPLPIAPNRHATWTVDDHGQTIIHPTMVMVDAELVDCE